MRKAALAFSFLALLALDGSQWKVQQKGILGTLLFWRTDVLQFVEGSLTSTENVHEGFLKTPYTAASDGNKSVWKAVQTNAKGDRLEWKASWSGERMKGTALYTWKDGRQKKVRWKAHRVK